MNAADAVATVVRALSNKDDVGAMAAITEIEQWRKDSARLSWLDRDDIALSFGADPSGGPFVIIQDARGNCLAATCDIRSAIDTAMEPK